MDRFNHRRRARQGSVANQFQAAHTSSEPSESVYKVVPKRPPAAEEPRLSHRARPTEDEELPAARQVIQEERQRFKELFESAPAGYVLTDTQGLIREATSIAAKLLQRRHASLIGKPLVLFVEASARQTFQTLLTRIQLGEEQQGWEIQVQPTGKAPFKEVAGAVHKARGLVDDLIARVRRIALDLRPPTLDDLGLLPTVLWHVRQFRGQTNVQVQVTQCGEVTSGPRSGNGGLPRRPRGADQHRSTCWSPTGRSAALSG